MVNRKAAFWLTMLLVVPFVASENSASMTLTPDEQYVAYPGQTVQHHLDVTFAGTSGTTLKLDLQSQYLSEITGNGQELVFDDGETKRFLWTLTLPSSTPYGYDTINATIIDTSDQSTQSVDVELKITAPSNINFGNTQSSTFVVDPSIRTNVATNITSNATLTDEITFAIQTDSSWNWGWTMDDVDGTNARLQLGPNTMDFVRIWIDVPDVIDGAPLANQGPTFRLVGTSGLDGAKIAWDFSLDVSSFRNVTIDSVQTDVVVDPAGNTRVDVSVRNTGNIPDTVSITLGNVVINGDAVEVDMTKAREIHKDNLRAERAPRLEALDVDYMKALEAGSGADAVAAQKKTLRDITADSKIADASTPDALKALDLATLLGE